MKKIGKRAIELLLRVKNHILENPDRLIMRAFVVTKDGLGTDTFKDDSGRDREFAECGTVACIAGWAVLLNDGSSISRLGIRERATKLLDLERDKEDELFEVSFWPDEFRGSYRAAKTQRTRAKIAAKRIDRFIEEHTDGRQVWIVEKRYSPDDPWRRASWANFPTRFLAEQFRREERSMYDGKRKPRFRVRQIEGDFK